MSRGIDMQLPIDEVLPRLDTLLAQESNVVLVAEPGAGKTTRVPLYLLNSSWLQAKKIIMLEPRRLAARSAVSFMANTRGEKIGETLGFRVRGESRVGPRTRVEVVTEGILTRIIQSQPELEGVGLIIFDEFHERSLNADLALALCLEIQRSIRPDLKILVMSATLEAQAVADLIGSASILKCPGRQFPVEIKYLSQKSDLSLDRLVSECIRRALRESEGDILVFLPGRGEISWISKRLDEKTMPIPVQVMALFSDLNSAQQDLVLRSKDSDKRKIILATSIAETSLTIDGVKVVIDSGLMRVPRFDPRRGMSGLETVAVSQASAEQRMGRAGRQSTGTCYRLWTENQHKELPRFNDPEILQADLSVLALELSLWGQGNFKEFSFLTPPPLRTYQQAQALLQSLGALDELNRITNHGRELSKLGVHPRIGHMLLRAESLGLSALACDVAALLEEKSVLSDRAADLEISSRWYALDRYRKDRKELAEGRAALSRVDKEAERLRNVIGLKNIHLASLKDLESVGVLAALAYPDRIAKRREESGSRYLLRNGSGVSLPEPCLLSRFEFLAVAHLDGNSEQGKIFLCEPIDISEIREYFAADIMQKVETSWDNTAQAIRARKRENLDSIVLSEQIAPPSKQEILPVMLEAIKHMGSSSLNWSLEAKSLVSRSLWLKSLGLVDSSWPDFSEQSLMDTLDLWLAPYLSDVSSRDDLQKIDLYSILLARLSWQQRKDLDQFAPTYWDLPTGTKARIDYESPLKPLLSVRLQEMLGQSKTPLIGNGTIAVTIELLSPAKRSLQVTKDLESFWKNSYQDVRKEMQGRYPKHFWPTDPINAVPTRRTKARS